MIRKFFALSSGLLVVGSSLLMTQPSAAQWQAPVYNGAARALPHVQRFVQNPGMPNTLYNGNRAYQNFRQPMERHYYEPKYRNSQSTPYMITPRRR